MTGMLGLLLLAISWYGGEPHKWPWVFALGLLVAMGGLMLRIWATGWLVKNANLTVGGPYNFTRNPLYLGTLSLVLGQSLMSGVPWTVAIFAPLCLLLYWPTLLEEAKFLRRIYGVQYAKYARQVPLLFPLVKFRGADVKVPSCQGFCWRRVQRCRKGFMANALLIVLYVFLLWK